ELVPVPLAGRGIGLNYEVPVHPGLLGRFAQRSKKRVLEVDELDRKAPTQLASSFVEVSWMDQQRKERAIPDRRGQPLFGVSSFGLLRRDVAHRCRVSGRGKSQERLAAAAKRERIADAADIVADAILAAGVPGKIEPGILQQVVELRTIRKRSGFGIA